MAGRSIHIEDASRGASEVRVSTEADVSRDLALIAPFMAPHTLKGEESLWRAALKVPDAVALALTNGRGLQALALLVKSHHDYGHWGIRLLSTSNLTAEDHPALQSLVQRLISTARDAMKRQIPHPEQATHVQEYPADSTAFTLVTSVPSAVEALGFVPIFGPHGDGTTWMMYCEPPSGVRHCARGLTPSNVSPAYDPAVRHLESRAEFAAAERIIAAEWGSEYAVRFAEEMRVALGVPGTAIYGAFDADTLRGIGVINKALYHPAAWSRSWIVTEAESRRRGIGERIVQTLLQHADDHFSQFAAVGPLIMEGSTIMPGYYAKFGSLPVMERSEGRHTRSWTMRITAAPVAGA